MMVDKGWDKGVAIVTADGYYGTGWWIDRNTMVTAAHVVEYKYKTVRVIHGYFETTGRVVSIDQKRDIAIIKTQSMPKDAYIFAIDKRVEKTETVYAIGYPYELMQLERDVYSLSANPRIAKGTISWISPDIGIAEITVSVDAGNSGGPVVNENGEVVGLVTFALKGRAATLYFITLSKELEGNVNYRVGLGLSHEQREMLKSIALGIFISVFTTFLVLYGFRKR